MNQPSSPETTKDNSSASDKPFEIGEEDRFDSMRLIPWWDQRRLSAAKIMVVGAGALGNEAIKNLVLLGVGNIVIVDMDRIEHSNLSRSVLYRRSDAGSLKADIAAARAKEIDPDLNVVSLPYNVIHQVGLGWFADVDCVLGCLDNREARLWVNRCCWNVGTPWIDAGIQEISGVVQVFNPPSGTCYECGMKQADYRLINLRYSCPLLRAEDVKKGRTPTTPTISSIIAGWQVQEALKLIHGLPTAESSAMVFHGMTNHIYQTKLPRREDCLSHDSWPPPTPLAEINQHSTVGELFTAVQATGKHPRSVRLLRDVVLGFQCGGCGTEHERIGLRAETPASSAMCPECKGTMSPKIISEIGIDDHALREMRLETLGIPPADVLPIELYDQDGETASYRLSDPTFDQAAFSGSDS